MMCEVVTSVEMGEGEMSVEMGDGEMIAEASSAKAAVR